MTILPNPDCPECNDLSTVFELIDNVMRIATAVAGGVAMIFLLWGAYNYFTAFGNEQKAQTGKTIVVWSIIGIIVIILSQVLVAFAKNQLM